MARGSEYGHCERLSPQIFASRTIKLEVQPWHRPRPRVVIEWQRSWTIHAARLGASHAVCLPILRRSQNPSFVFCATGETPPRLACIHPRWLPPPAYQYSAVSEVLLHEHEHHNQHDSCVILVAAPLCNGPLPSQPTYVRVFAGRDDLQNASSQSKESVGVVSSSL